MRLSALVLLAGCSQVGLKDPSFPTGSSTIVAREHSLYAVNAWDGTLTRTDWKDNVTRELDVGGEPTRLAPVGDELWVTLRSERSVAIFRTTSTMPEEQERIKVGAEPYGIVASEDGTRVYVALSQEDAIVEIDAASREVIRRFEVGNDPRWIALHPSGKALYVSYGYPHALTQVDLDSGDITDHDFPDTYLPPNPTPGTGLGDADGPTPLVPRNTGDIAFSPRGDVLAVPTLYVDPSTPGNQPLVSGDDIQVPPVPYYVGANVSGLGLQLSLNKFDPAMVLFPIDPDDGSTVPHERTLAVFVGGFDQTSTVRGYVSSATFDPDGTEVYAAMESANAVAVLDLRPVDGQGLRPSVSSINAPDSGSAGIAPAEGNFWERGQVFVSVGNSPSGIAVDGDGYKWVHERGNRKVGWFRTNQIADMLDKVSEGTGYAARFGLSGRFEAGTVHVDPDVEAGRQLFYTADNAAMSFPGSGVSCSTCHFEGRNDGLTWAFDSNPRQTPSLAGPVGETVPVTWTLQVPTVGSEVQITSIGRMGGQGVTPFEAGQIGAFIEHSRDVDTSDKGKQDALIARGATLFASSEVGCVSCHNGKRFTDNLTHHLFGIDVNTPSLVGVDATAPYFHDGSAASLRDVLLRVRDGSMGSTAGLSNDDLKALEAYLKTL